MSIFLTNVITSAGAQLLRDCEAAEKKIVFTRARCGSQWDENRDGVGYHDVDWFDGAEGTIAGVSVGGNVKVKASFAAVDSGTDPVKSVCICAQAKKDGVDPEYDEADDVIFAVSSDDNSGIISGIAFDVVFDMPTQCLGLVDAVGAVDDSVTLDTEQTITGVKTFKPTDSASSLYFSDGGLLTLDALSEGGAFLVIDPLNAEVAIKLDPESSQKGFMINTMPLEVAYSTANKTIDLTLGDGTVVRLTCTNVEENPE